MEFSTFLQAWSNRKLNAMYYFAYGSSIFDAENVMAGLYETGSRIYQPNPEIDRLAKAARESLDPKERLNHFLRVTEITKKTGIYLPLYIEYSAFGQRSGVNWPAMPDGFIRLYDFKKPAPK
jgi:peptide/nickel transport system substrate-binding protein